MFHFLITPYLLDIFYVLGALTPFYFIIRFYGYIKSIITKNYKYKKEIIFAIILVLIGYELALRIFCEFIIVYFNMYDELKNIKEIVNEIHRPN